MQQQWHPLASQQNPTAQQQTQQNIAGLGQLQNLNASVLVNAFQQTAPTGQNTLQGAENILASMLAAANNGAQGPAAPPQQFTQVPLAQQQQVGLAAIPGLEQLSALGPAVIQQTVYSQPQQGVQAATSGQTIGGLQNLQNQLVNFQQQLGLGQQALMQGAETDQQQQPLVQQQQQLLQSQQQPQQQQSLQPQNQQQLPPWMGQNWNPAALSLAGSLPSSDNNSIQNQDGLLQQFQGMQNGQHFVATNLGLGAQATFPFQQQQQQQRIQQTAPPPREKESKPSNKAKRFMDKKKKAKSFPEKLMQAMMGTEDEEAVAWLPDGKSFVVVNPDLLCSKILNRVFKESKYASFVRKLHRYDVRTGASM